MYLNERNHLCSKKLAALKGLVVVNVERSAIWQKHGQCTVDQYSINTVSVKVAVSIIESGYLLVESLGIVFSSMVTKQYLSLGSYILSKFSISSLKLLLCFLELFQQQRCVYICITEFTRLSVSQMTAHIMK